MKLIKHAFWFILLPLSAHSATLDQAYFQLSQTLKEAQQEQEALIYLHKTITANPEHPQAAFQLGMHYYQQDKIDCAYPYLETACKFDPQNFQAFLHAGICAMSFTHIDQAIFYFQHAIELDPSSPKAHFFLGHAHMKNKSLNTAIKEFSLTIQLSPNSTDAHLQLANALRDNHEFDASLDYYEKALILDPVNQQTLFEKALALALQGNITQAMELYVVLHTQNPSSQTLLYNRAHLYKKMHQYEQAIELYLKILSISPHFHQAYLAVAQAYLSIGKYHDGFKALASSCKNHITEKPLLARLSDAKDKTILVTASWNNEDMIQLLTFVPLLKKAGARILLQADTQIAPLLILCPYIDQVIISGNAQIPDFDMHISLLALPSLCIWDNTLPAFEPYIFVSAKSSNQWRSKIKSERINIGIYWKSNEIIFNKNEDKNIPFSLFHELIEQPNFCCIALQQLSCQECNQLPAQSMISLLGKNICPEKDIVQFCSIIDALDIIITCDSLVAHLAGALGKCVILIIPEISQWRWVARENQSCFYPSIHIIQVKENNYSEVSDKVSDYLGKYSVA